MTLFTDIIEGKRPGFIFFEDEHHVAILDKDPLKVKTDDLLKINVLATMCAGNIFR